MARSNISGIVANQVGKMRGAIEAQIQDQVITISNEFVNQCPNFDRFMGFVSAKNTILKHLQTFESKISKFEAYASRLDRVIRSLKRLISLYKRLPVKTATGIPPTKGGLFGSVSLGRTNTQSDLLRKADKLLEAVEDDKQAILDIVAGIKPSVQQAKQSLQALDALIQDCAESGLNDSSADEESKAALRAVLNQIQTPENTGSEGTPDDSYLYRGLNGKEYSLEIIDVISQTETLQKRQAVAKDFRGVIILRGPQSYSSDTKVLLDELKFRIDNQLP